MKQEFHIVVAGAGLAGLSAAAFLARSPVAGECQLTLLDAAPRAAFDADAEVGLRVSSIASGTAELLDSVGAWQSVMAARACAYESMRVWDAASSPDSPSALRFDAAEFAVPALGYIVENQLLQHCLLTVLDAAGIDMRFATSVAALQPRDGRHDVELDDGTQLRCDLLIAADGANSQLRDQLGIETRDLAYHQTAFVTHLEPELPHRHTAWQRFLPEGPLGMLPLEDGRISVVWSGSDENAEWAMQAGDAELGEALTAASDDVLGDLTVAGPRGRFPLRARHAEHYVVRGAALLGDAAHVIHPLAGQGANLGIHDAEALADVLATAIGNGEHPGDRSVLRRYERAQKGDNAAMLHFMTGLNRLFTTDSALLKELRTTGMRFFNLSGPIRERVVKVALGSRR